MKQKIKNIEDELVIRKMKKLTEEIKQGKRKVFSENDVRKKLQP